MEKPTPRPNPMYPGEMTDENIRRIFLGAADFNTRTLQCGEFILYAYAIDGLISSDSASEYIIQPIMEQLSGDTMQALYHVDVEVLSLYEDKARVCIPRSIITPVTEEAK